MKLFTALATAGLLIVANVASAQSPAPSGACKADIEKYCSGISEGDGRIKACMKEHRKELSAGCKSELKAAHAKKAQAAQPAN